jgi:translation initiation factor 3 subunit K
LISPAKTSLLTTRRCRYQFNPHLNRDETITNVLVKALTVFPDPDFSLCLSLLPSHTLAPLNSSAHAPAAGDAPLSEAVQKLNELKNLLEGADYDSFWTTLDSDDLYADLIADVSGFEEAMRVRIAATVSQAVRVVARNILESWLNLQGNEFEHFVGTVCGWEIDGAKIKIPTNKDNEAKGTVVRENVKFDRKCRSELRRQDQANRHCRILKDSQESVRAACIKYRSRTRYDWTACMNRIRRSEVVVTCINSMLDEYQAGVYPYKFSKFTQRHSTMKLKTCPVFAVPRRINVAQPLHYIEY